MTKPGHIEITDKIRFVYHKLEKPLKNSCLNVVIHNRRIKEYKASKRTIEVSNVRKVAYLYFFYFGDKVIMHPDYELKDNNLCKAKVNGKAKIIELINN